MINNKIRFYIFRINNHMKIIFFMINPFGILKNVTQDSFIMVYFTNTFFVPDI